MSLSPDPKREHPSSYFVRDRANQEELNRLYLADQMLTTSMGGVLPEQPDPTCFERVLDIGCGTGSWLIELAQTMPACEVFVGVDASHTFVEYARVQADAAQVSDRVKFYVADTLRISEFPDGYFDLVNHRAASSWVHTWDWLKILQEYQRVCHPQGVVRITEPEWMWDSSIPGLSCLSELWLQAGQQAGYLFTPTRDGVTNQLANLLHQHGLQQVQTRAVTLEYRAGTVAWQRFFENAQFAFRTGLPFLYKWTHVPDDYEHLCQQVLNEMQQPDFVATLGLLTVWGHPKKVLQ